MGPKKIMIIRHAEKPGDYTNCYRGYNEPFQGVGLYGNGDKESLVTLGWERAGGIASLFAPANGQFQNPHLNKPDAIYASDPIKSQRPFQTISALAYKTGAKLNTQYAPEKFPDMVKDVLANPAGTILISWQHQDILPDPKKQKTDCIVSELVKHAGYSGNTQLPAKHWPEERYDMVFVFDRPGGTGSFTSFTQVPQLLLAGDSITPIL